MKSYIFIILLTARIIKVATNRDLLNVTLTDILKEKCRVAKGIGSPTDLLGYPTDVDISFWALRFLGIDDVSESIKVAGSITAIWKNDCVLEVLTSNVLNISENGELIFDFNDIWYPRLLFLNSLEQKKLTGSDFEVGLAFSEKYFRIFTYGNYEAFCDLDFWNFPFDVQNCTLEFFIADRHPFVALGNLSIINQSNWEPTNSIWQSQTISANWVPSPLNPSTSNIIFSFVFKRRHQYYVLNLFIPATVLQSLLLASFYISPNTPDRTAFSATIMLAHFVVQSQVLSYLPKTSQHIVVAYWVISGLIFGMLVTIYSGSMCYMIDKHPHMARKVSLFQCTLIKYKLIDQIVFWMFLSISLLSVAICFSILLSPNFQ